MNEKQLLALKETAETADRAILAMQGQISYLKKELKEKFDCSSIEEAKAQIETLSNQIATLAQKIKEGVENLEKKYVP